MLTDEQKQALRETAQSHRERLGITMEPYSPEWQREAGALARSYAPPIYPCKKCSHPVVQGYCCTTCGTSEPR